MKPKNTITLKVLVALIFLSATLDSHAQGWLNKAKGVLKDVTEGKASGFTEEDAAQAIRDALSQGTSKGTDLLSKADGYFGNPEVKIPFPKDAEKVESTLRKIGMGRKVDDAVLSINRAAELAAVEAKSIFLDAITSMTIEEAINIIKGNDRAATSYLQKTTTNNLTEKFTPVIQSALEKVDATKYWSTVINAYNNVPFVQKVNPNLTEYATSKAIEGLFMMIAKEELNIRKDPLARTTDILKKVFGK